MIDKEYLLKELSNGKSIDDLANEITAALNAAKQEYEVTNSKVNDGNELADVINYYIATYYDNFGKEGPVVSRKDIEDICDVMADIIKYADELKDSLCAVPEKLNFQKKKKADSDDAVIEKWLRSLG